MILIIRLLKTVTRLAPSWSARGHTTIDRKMAVEAVQKFERIKLPKGDTVAGLIAEGRR